jgi:iron uptake system component EfeO
VYLAPLLLNVLHPRSWRLVRVPALLVAGFVVAGCGAGAHDGATGGASGANIVAVKITDDGCPAALRLPPGPTTFAISNDGGNAVDEFEILDGDKIVGEVEDITPGRSGTFSLTLEPGSYRTYCPGGKRHEHGKLTVAAGATVP